MKEGMCLVGGYPGSHIGIGINAKKKAARCICIERPVLCR